MTEQPNNQPTGEPAAPADLTGGARDAYADTVAATDPGPDALGVADDPDPNPERTAEPRDADGTQDAPQTPDGA